MMYTATNGTTYTLDNNGEWIPEELERLCSDAGLADAWAAADGETFEAVVYKACDILGIQI